jgi:arsenate reductase
MAESILTKLGEGRFDAYSAGSHPTWRINPFALEALRLRGYPTDALTSKSWNEFSRFDASGLDFVIAVCDKAASEPQPYWPGRPITTTWMFPSPDAVQGSDDEVRAVFESVCDLIEAALRAFVALPLDALDANATRTLLAEIAPK